MKNESIFSTPMGPKTFKDPPGRSPAMKQELDQLRQRGLTKSLARHFTQECQKVEAELAAAEAALAELEARKARAAEFAPSSNEITLLDMLCMKVAEWKRQCRKNEQETVLLYARYCEKWGKSIELAKPEDLVKCSKPSSPGLLSSSPLATADVETLVKAFEKAKRDSNGIPDFLRPSEASSLPSFNKQELEEILEDASLQDPEATCIELAATPETAAMDSDIDDSSIVSGLTTLNSAVTREVLHDVESKVLDFIKNETENIRKMMEEDAISKAEPSVAVSRAHSRSDSVAEHENMVARMQQILDDFKRAEEESKKEESPTSIRRIEAGNEGEEWYEHFDITFQRHFYVEAKTNKTQWEMPQAVADASVAEGSFSSSADSGGSLPTMAPAVATVPSYQEFIPEPRSGNRSKRVEIYRAKVRRQRNRQLVVGGVTFLVLGAAFMFYRHTNPEPVDRALQAVASVSGMVSNSNVVVERKANENTATKKKEAVSEAVSVEDRVKTVPQKKKITEIEPSFKSSVPATVSKTTQSPTPVKNVELPLPVPLINEVAEKMANKEMLTPEEPGENYGLAPFKSDTQHWILDVLIGPLAFKEVNRKCSDKGRYCGFHYC